jgi:hypothetical protein
MKSQWKRLVLAAVISSSVFAVTWIWYQSTGNKIESHGNESPLAYVGKAVDDIQRRPASRLLWQSVYSGEALYNGEAIRTSERGEARIQFTGSDRYLDLEPESLIVIKKSEGEIALDLMEGSLFVKNGAQQKGAPGLVLNSANGKVDLSQASASLSKSGNNSLDVQVLEGKASIKSKDGKNQELTTGSTGELGANGVQFNRSQLQILNPLPHKPFYMNPDDIKPVSFKWNGFPPNAFVSLYIGNTRKDLKEIAKSTDPQAHELNAKVTLGRHFWKLVATDAAGKVLGESSIYRTEMVARYAPTVLAPSADTDVAATGPNSEFNFKWQTSDETRQVTVEVWSDKELKHLVSAKSVQDSDNLTVSGLKEGTYFWRMSTYFEDADKPLVGKIQKFTVKSQARLEAERKAARQPVAINWASPDEQPTQFYFDKPKIGLSWKPGQSNEIASYRVTLQEADGDATAEKTFQVKDSHLQAPVEKPGRYIASIEALDKDGDVMGSSQQKTISVAPLPLLPAPQFLPADGVLQAGQDGRSHLEWQKINGAKAYELTILKDGKELKKSRYATNSTSIRNLMPGEYEVQVNAVDEHGRLSEGKELRKLSVPDSSGLKAPTVKKIKVH